MHSGRACLSLQNRGSPAPMSRGLPAPVEQRVTCTCGAQGLPACLSHMPQAEDPLHTRVRGYQELALRYPVEHHAPSAAAKCRRGVLSCIPGRHTGTCRYLACGTRHRPPAACVSMLHSHPPLRDYIRVPVLWWQLDPPRIPDTAATELTYL